MRSCNQLLLSGRFCVTVTALVRVQSLDLVVVTLTRAGIVSLLSEYKDSFVSYGRTFRPSYGHNLRYGPAVYKGIVYGRTVLYGTVRFWPNMLL